MIAALQSIVFTHVACIRTYDGIHTALVLAWSAVDGDRVERV